MIRSLAVAAGGDLPGIAAIGIHDPEGGNFAGGRATKSDLTTIWRNTGPKIPSRRIAVREANRLPGLGIAATNPYTTAGRIRLVVTIEMIDVGAL